MKFLERIVENMEPKFAKGAKLEKLHPVFESFTTLAFTPKEVTHKGSHIRDGVDLKRTMMTVIIAMIPCLLFGMVGAGHWHYVANPTTDVDVTSFWASMGPKIWYGLGVLLPLIIVSYGVGLTVEFIFAIIKGHSLHEGFLVSGLLIPLIMPADVPLWMVAIAVAFAVLIGKEVFGGTGMNVVNVALTARAFLFFAYPTSMSGNSVWFGGQPDGFSGPTALGELATFTSDDQASWAFQNISEFTSKYTMEASWMGYIPGSIGETSAVACLIGAAILLFTGVASWRVMVSFFAGGLAMSALFNVWGANEFMLLEPLHMIALGGFFFGGVFMITDPVTASQTNTGKFIYGFLGGFLSIMIRVFNPAYPEGVMMAILFMNVMAPLIDHYVVQANVKRRLKRLKTA
ncbi:MAG: NADH:ubiquinone reductase (Na(+)-transporting) subunit B [Crocinitomicaceae bacterium]|nr:NADH:ubiquinone reductase (Na(+)-transporting) subunit B [Crocinitomicaceae bacterium]